MKINRVIFHRDFKDWYEAFFYPSDVTVDFPYIAGDFSSVVPEEFRYSPNARREEIRQPLFNKSDLGKIVVNVGKDGIYYLNIRPGYKLKDIMVEPEEVIVDIYFSLENTLLYSFYNPTSNENIVITVRIEEDKDNVYSRIKSDPTDIILRQYFVRRALKKLDVSRPLPRKEFPDLMTAEQLAEYLNMEVKTILNWSSDGKLPKVKLGGSLRFRKSDIDKLLEEKTIPIKKKRKG